MQAMRWYWPRKTGRCRRSRATLAFSWSRRSLQAGKLDTLALVLGDGTRLLDLAARLREVRK